MEAITTTRLRNSTHSATQFEVEDLGVVATVAYRPRYGVSEQGSWVGKFRFGPDPDEFETERFRSEAAALRAARYHASTLAE